MHTYYYDKIKTCNVLAHQLQFSSHWHVSTAFMHFHGPLLKPKDLAYFAMQDEGTIAHSASWEHIYLWMFAVTHDTRVFCPCSDSTTSLPNFVPNTNYFCDSTQYGMGTTLQLQRAARWTPLRGSACNSLSQPQTLSMCEFVLMRLQATKTSSSRAWRFMCSKSNYSILTNCETCRIMEIL